MLIFLYECLYRFASVCSKWRVSPALTINIFKCPSPTSLYAARSRHGLEPHNMTVAICSDVVRISKQYTVQNVTYLSDEQTPRHLATEQIRFDIIVINNIILFRHQFVSVLCNHRSNTDRDLLRLPWRRMIDALVAKTVFNSKMEIPRESIRPITDDALFFKFLSHTHGP